MIVKRIKKEERFYTSPMFKLKAAIGRARVNAAKKIQQSIDKDLEKAIGAAEKTLKGKKPKSNVVVDKTLGKIAKKINTTVRRDIDLTGGLVDKKLRQPAFTLHKNDTIMKALQEEKDNPIASKALKHLNRKGKKSLITVLDGGVDTISHELGHVARGKSRNPITRLINKYANNPEIRTLAQENSGDLGAKRGILESAKGFLKGSAIVAEEAGASRYGLKQLRKAGLPKEELEKSAENLKNALGTYKAGRNRMWKSPLREMVQIPSRRVK